MKILKNRQLVEDTWTTLSAESDLLAGDVIVPFARWQNDKNSFASHQGKIGIQISSDTNIDEVIENIAHFDLIALNFPKYTDGTCFSYAFLLRERHHFSGELRAVGDIFRDQFAYLERCGIDAIELEDEKALEEGKNSFDDISMAYQSSADKAEPLSRLR